MFIFLCCTLVILIGILSADNVYEYICQSEKRYCKCQKVQPYDLYEKNGKTIFNCNLREESK